MVSLLTLLSRPVPRDSRHLLNLSLEPLVQFEHTVEFDGLDTLSCMAFMAFGLFVGVIVPDDRVAADFTDVETVSPSAWVRFVVGFSDGDVYDIPVFDVLPVGNGRNRTHPVPYVIPSIGLNLWPPLHRAGAGDDRLDGRLSGWLSALPIPRRGLSHSVQRTG